MTAGSDGEMRRRWAWVASAATALIAAAWWLRAASPAALMLATVGAVAMLVLGARLASGKRRAAIAGALVVLASVAAVPGQRALQQLRSDWPAYAARTERDGLTALQREVAQGVTKARAAARAALDMPRPPAGTMRLPEAPASGGDIGVVRYQDTLVVGWSGVMRVSPERLTAPVGAVFTPFYLVAYATEVRDGARATATVLVHAEPPADQLAAALDESVMAQSGVGKFAYASVAAAGSFELVEVDGQPLFAARAVAPTPMAAEVAVLERSRGLVGPLLALALLAMVAAAWGRGATLRIRLVALWVVLAAVAATPLNVYSNTSRIFDPAVYFARFGGPFTATLAALAATSATALLALLALQRSPGRVLSRRQAAVAVVVIAALGPLLLRDLAQGIVLPSDGASFALWAAWQGALFLAAMAIVVAGTAAGRDALAARRGLSPAVGPTLAALAAGAAPLLWRAPEGWPDWYTAVWALAILALALARRSPWFIVSCALVAGPGAVTLVWGATSRARVELARADVVRLRTPDREILVLLERFIRTEQALGPAGSRAELLSRFARSELSAAGALTHLASWSPSGEVVAQLDLAPFPEDAVERLALVNTARRDGTVRVVRASNIPWLQLMVAIPHLGGAVTTIVVAPRSRLLPDDPFGVLLGLAPAVVADPPYSLSLAGAAAPVAGPRERWQRRGTELHGDWEFAGVNGPMRVHASVELRSMESLVPRGALLVLADVVLVALLWAGNVAAGGALRRWLRLRRDVWLGSFRVRLTLGLFAFALLPVLAFAAVAVRRLQSDDLRSRELVVLETLRGAVSSSEDVQLLQLAERLDTPLLLYGDGALLKASEPLHEVLAPTGRFLDQSLLTGLGPDDLIATTREERLGRYRALVGYRSIEASTYATRFLLAAPARTDALELDRRRNDLLILLLFAASAAALAAFWLSGVVARQLASPIEVLRRNALAVAAGERPELPGTPLSEFVPVFRAFGRMTDDLGESRAALEAAQRRTAAVLLNVASGVVAVDEGGVVVLANPRAEAIIGSLLPAGSALEGGIAGSLGREVRSFALTEAPEREFDLPVGARRLHARLTRLPSSRGFVITVDDVTELARAQRVLAWGEMARQVAHEIKNPLTPIRLGVQHLQRARHDPRVDFDEVLTRNVERILAEIDRLDEIARTFSRFGTTPAARPAREGVAVDELLRDVVALEGLGAGDEVQWVVEVAPALPRALARDDEFREVLLNLLENARLADARTVRVEARTMGDRVMVTVADDGDGIAADALPRVFEPHFSTRTSGSGLGLAICRRLVEGWGGAIGLESVPGRGTTVTLTLAAASHTGELPPR